VSHDENQIACYSMEGHVPRIALEAAVEADSVEGQEVIIRSVAGSRVRGV
jgi:hypothetical protein